MGCTQSVDVGNKNRDVNAHKSVDKSAVKDLSQNPVVEDYTKPQDFEVNERIVSETDGGDTLSVHDVTTMDQSPTNVADFSEQERGKSTNLEAVEPSSVSIDPEFQNSAETNRQSQSSVTSSITDIVAEFIEKICVQVEDNIENGISSNEVNEEITDPNEIEPSENLDVPENELAADQEKLNDDKEDEIQQEGDETVEDTEVHEEGEEGLQQDGDTSPEEVEGNIQQGEGEEGHQDDGDISPKEVEGNIEQDEGIIEGDVLDEGEQQQEAEQPQEDGDISPEEGDNTLQENVPADEEESRIAGESEVLAESSPFLEVETPDESGNLAENTVNHPAGDVEPVKEVKEVVLPPVKTAELVTLETVKLKPIPPKKSASQILEEKENRVESLRKVEGAAIVTRTIPVFENGFSPSELRNYSDDSTERINSEPKIPVDQSP